MIENNFMRNKLTTIAISLITAIFLCSCASFKENKTEKVYNADIIVYGGTSAAVTAAVQADAEGKSVIIVSPDLQLGAMTTSGLGFTDAGKAGSIGGLSREFYHRIWKAYQNPNAWNWQPRKDWKGFGQGTKAIDDKTKTMWVFEPKVGEQVYNCWLSEKGILVHRGEFLDRESGVELEGGRIVGIKTLSGKKYVGKMFIDCTFEGDLMAAAGCDYHVGREANSVYNEEWNGLQKGVLHHDHFFEKKIDPYREKGNPSSGLLKYISQEKLDAPNGTGDEKVQAYCFRMCLTKNPANRVFFSKPDNYNPEDYELFARYFEAVGRTNFLSIGPMPNMKTDCNNCGAFSTDFIGMNYEYPDASYQKRAEIIKAHKDYQMGWLYFIQNDPRVPQKARDALKDFGLSKDEFVATDNWPFNLYIREARRMIGEYVMTEHDCKLEKDTPMSVGMGSYTLDSHNIQRYITPDGWVQNEGDIGVHLNAPYKISYLSITPKSSQCENLLVPVACSASHAAYGSIRMEPVFMILGQSAATAASIAIDDSVSVQKVDYGKLSKKLRADGQILTSEEMIK